MKQWFQPVSPSLKGPLNCQELPVAYIVVAFRWREPFAEKGAWVQFLVLLLPLRKYCTCSGVRGIHLYHKGASRIRMNEDGSGSETSLELYECPVSLGIPAKTCLSEVGQGRMCSREGFWRRSGCRRGKQRLTDATYP